MSCLDFPKILILVDSGSFGVAFRGIHRACFFSFSNRINSPSAMQQTKPNACSGAEGVWCVRGIAALCVPIENEKSSLFSLCRNKFYLAGY